MNQFSPEQIEDMFYNTPTRLSAMRSPSEEYARILDVVTKYAVHNSKVAFLCKKVCRSTMSLLSCDDYTDQAGSATPELSTSSTSIDQVIRLLYGHSVGKELLHVEVSSSATGEAPRPPGSCDVGDTEIWTAEIYCTSPNYQAKKTIFLLFINRKSILQWEEVRLLMMSQTVSSNRPVSNGQSRAYTAGYYPKEHSHSCTSGTNNHLHLNDALKVSASR